MDDEEDVRRVLTFVLEDAGYKVAAAEDPEVAVKTASRLGKEGVPFILVTDLGMPTSGGSSFHGGFEIVKRLWKMNLRPPVLMMTESLSPALQLRARQMKIGSFVFKPGLSKLNPRQFEADLLTFGQRLAVEALPRLEAELRAAELAPKGPDKPEPGPVPPPAAEAEPDALELSRQFRELQRRLSDLRRPTEAKEISLLVMKVAREYFERGVLFLVRHEEIKGLGGFGPAPRGHTLNLLAREVVVSLAEPSIFRDVVVGGPELLRAACPRDERPRTSWARSGASSRGRWPCSPWSPTARRSRCSSATTPRPDGAIGRLDALEVFVNQAGVAFENAFLQRKIQNLQGQAG